MRRHEVDWCLPLPHTRLCQDEAPKSLAALLETAAAGCTDASATRAALLNLTGEEKQRPTDLSPHLAFHSPKQRQALRGVRGQ
jgi:hypothetical protein